VVKSVSIGGIKLAAPLAFQRAQFLKGGVQPVPDLTGQRGAHDAAAFARLFDAGRDRGRVVMVEEQPGFDVFLIDLIAIAVGKGLTGPRGAQQRFPFVAIALFGIGQQRDARAHVQKTGGGFRAFQVAAHPEQVRGGAAEHICPLPLFRQDPGVLDPAALRRVHHQRAFAQRHAGQPARHQFDPVAAQAIGPQIDMARRDAFSSTKVGQVDSASVGWAM
jgi:hypothetical protein